MACVAFLAGPAAAEPAGADEPATAGEQAADAGDGRIDPAAVATSAPVYRVDDPVSVAGERWEFGFRWLGIPVGRVTVDVDTETGEDGVVRLRAALAGRTSRFVDLFWRYRMAARGHLDVSPFRPRRLYVSERENDRAKTTLVELGEDGRIDATRRRGSRVQTASFHAPNTYDVLSTIFVALSLDYSAGRSFQFDVFTGASRYLLRIDVVGHDEVRVLGRSTPAWRLDIASSPLTDPDERGKHRGTTLWVERAAPHRLLRATTDTYVASVTGTLEAVTEVPDGAFAPVDSFDRGSAIP